VLLQSLVNYYEILTENENCDIPKRGYSKAKVSYALTITKNGDLIGILPLKQMDAKGKKQIAIEMDVPEQVKRAVNISPNFLCDNSSYVLGFDNKGKPKRSKDCFQAFRQLHTLILKEAACEEANALILFLERWDTEKASEHPVYLEFLEDIYKGANFVFRLDGQMKFLHQVNGIRNAWEQYKSSAEDLEIRRCLVTGEQSKIARLHPSIRGIKGGQSMGNTLISFNDMAYESYGNVKAQGLNSPVSEYAAFAYGTVLNYMLSDINHRMTLGDSTIIFWAESVNSKYYQDVFSLTSNPDELTSIETGEQNYIRDESAVKEVKSIFSKISNGSKVNQDFSVSDETKFFVLALSPNAARISIRFMLYNNFGSYMNMLSKHYEDMAIEKQYDKDPNSISIWRLLNETVAPSSTDKAASPLLAGSVLRAILTGSSYPVALYNAIMIRIRAEKEINYCKAALIKAYLLRCRHAVDYNKEGVLNMSLNTQSENKAYVLGRLFAALEKAQRDANPNINATIKDRYFTSACANPAQTFPVLLRLSNHHISKAEYGFKNENNINDIMQLLKVENNPYPKSLSLEEQGIFILGYYHQRNKYYADMKEASELKKVKADK
jgi:CRISPR-associated protein Csd1